MEKESNEIQDSMRSRSYIYQQIAECRIASTDECFYRLLVTNRINICPIFTSSWLESLINKWKMKAATESYATDQWYHI